MSVREDLGISAAEWQQIDDSQQAAIIQKAARLQAHREILSTAMLEDDDREIRQRAKLVTASLLGRDANSCEDEPVEMPESDEMRVTVLGDYNQGDAAIEIKTKQQVNSGVVMPPPPPKKGSNVPKWLLPILGSAMGAALVFGSAYWFANQPSKPTDGNGYNAEAIPYFPSR